MSNTRFSYDNSRTIKKLQESTGPGRWILDQPGTSLNFYVDPHIRLEKFGANLCNENPVDISSELQGRNTTQTQFGRVSKGINITQKEYSNMKPFTSETRTTHPVFLYRNMENNRWDYPLLNTYLENPIQNNSTRIIQKNNFVPNNIWKQ